MDDGMQHVYAPPTGLALGKVKDTVDSQSRGRVQVTLLASGVDVWAACIVPSAGLNYGVALLPKQDEIVLVAFLTPDQAFVVGAVWSGQNSAPSAAAPVQNRYAITTAKGTTLLFDDTGPSSFSVTTPGNNSVTLTDAGGGNCTIQVGMTTIEITSTGVTINSTATISLQTQSMSVSSPSVTVDAATQQNSGLVQCDTLISNTVMGASYTPGAGNIW